MCHLLRTTGIPIEFNKKPEPKESATVSAMPKAVAMAKEVETDGKNFFSEQTNQVRW